MIYVNARFPRALHSLKALPQTAVQILKDRVCMEDRGRGVHRRCKGTLSTGASVPESSPTYLEDGGEVGIDYARCPRAFHSLQALPHTARCRF